MNYSITNTPIIKNEQGAVKELLKRLEIITNKHIALSCDADDEYENGYADGMREISEYLSEALYLFTVERELENCK